MVLTYANRACASADSNKAHASRTLKASKPEQTEASGNFETVQSGYLFEADELERTPREASCPEEFKTFKELITEKLIAR